MATGMDKQHRLANRLAKLEDKLLDFDIWIDKKNSMIIRVSYSRMGNWEYRLKNFE